MFTVGIIYICTRCLMKSETDFADPPLLLCSSFAYNFQLFLTEYQSVSIGYLDQRMRLQEASCCLATLDNPPPKPLV